MDARNDTRYGVAPGFVGLLAGILFILSRYFSASHGAGLESLSTVLVIVALCVSIHLVRRTSALTQDHVWDGWRTLCLIALPLTNLALSGVQLVLLRTPAFFESRAYSAVFTFLSMPVFFCVYFLYAARRVCKNRRLKLFSCVMLALGGAYMLLRLTDKVLFPLISQWAGKPINPSILQAAAWNTHLSFIIFLLSVYGFVIMMRAEPAEGKEEK